MSKAKTQLKLILAREVKNSENQFFAYLIRRRVRDGVGPVLSGTRDLVIKVMEKAEVFCTFFSP